MMAVTIRMRVSLDVRLSASAIRHFPAGWSGRIPDAIAVKLREAAPDSFEEVVDGERLA